MLGATKTHVVSFSPERVRERMAIPGICGNGHSLTPEPVDLGGLGGADELGSREGKHPLTGIVTKVPDGHDEDL